MADATRKGNAPFPGADGIREDGIRYHLRLPKVLLRIYWMRLRNQLAQEALAALGIAVGVALIFAVQIANTSIPASVRALFKEVVGKASIEIGARSPEGFDQSLLAKVGEVPGVFGASGVLDSRITVIGPRGQLALSLFGADSAIGAIGGPLPHRFSLQSLEDATPAPMRGMALANQLHSAHLPAIALPEGPARTLGAATGQLLLVETRGHMLAVLCGRVLGPNIAGAAVESPLAIASLATAQRITGMSHLLTRILVMPQPGRKASVKRSLARQLGQRLNVRASDGEASLLEAATRSQGQAATVFTVVSLVAALLFAYNAMLLTLPSRRRWITRLRNTGVYRYEIALLLLLDVCLLGLAASVIGLALGYLLSGAAFAAVPGYLSAGFPISPQRVITILAVLLSVAAGMLATIGAAIGPVIGSLRGNPLEAGSEGDREMLFTVRRAEALGLSAAAVAIAASFGLAAFVPGSGLVAVGALGVGLGLLIAASLRRVIERAVHQTKRMRSVAAYVAAIELRAAPTRAIAVAGTSAIALFAIVAVGGAASDIRRGAAQTTYELGGGAQVFVHSGRARDNPFPVQPFAAAAVMTRLRSSRGISGLGVYRGSFLDLDGRRLLVMAQPEDVKHLISSAQVIDGSANDAAHLIARGGWVEMSAVAATAAKLRIGQRFALPTPSGYATFRLAATISNLGWPTGTLVMNSADYARLWKTDLATAIQVHLDRGVSEDSGVRLVEAAVAGTGLTVTGYRREASEINAAANEGLAQLNQITSLMLIAATLAVIAAMAGSIWQRRARLANLTRLGMSRGDCVRAMYLETALVVVIGALAGATFGLCAQPIATGYVRVSTGFPVVSSPAVLLASEAVCIATMLAALITGALGYFVTSARATRT